jgi:intracellular sulfur oxidation DsrE/DsrF family protein
MYLMAQKFCWSGLLSLLILPIVLCSGLVQADELETVTQILARKSAPAGVVFEMVGGNAESFNIALRRTEAYVEKLRGKFPEADYAIVTHGVEQFTLLENKKEKYPELHQRVLHIIKDEKIHLHVCAALAKASDVDPADFIEFVDVVESGPAQIDRYVSEGYALVEMELH